MKNESSSRKGTTSAAEALDVYLRRSQLGELDWPTEIANVMSAALKVRDAELALCPDAQSKLAALGKYVDFARDLEKLAGRGWLKKDGDVADNMPLEAARIREAALEMELKRAELRRELAQNEQQQICRPRRADPAAAAGAVEEGRSAAIVDRGTRRHRRRRRRR